MRTLARLIDYGIATPREDALAVTFALPPAQHPVHRLEVMVTPPPVNFMPRPACGLRPDTVRSMEPSPEVTL